LYDTATRTVRDFTPREPGRAGIYLCGVTVQSVPHIGHLRSGVNFDVLRRWLEHAGLQVTFVRNVTDIDDKVLAKSAAAGIPWWAWAAANERVLDRSYGLIGCLPPTVEPRATGHITDMLTMIGELIAAGHAYAVAGDVYFDIRSWPAYGELSGQRPADMLTSDDGSTGVKRDPHDFALWKGHKAEEPATAAWPAPWGAGRPGWHLECSAMARRYLGPEFDIHGGGLDLVFPHHENELAQSRAAGDEFARYWLHHAWLTLAGEKMSKSLGNTLSVDEVVKKVRPIELRYYMVQPHYRSGIEFSEESLLEAAAGFRRIEGFVQRAAERHGPGEPNRGLPAAFVEAMNDDLGTPAACAIVHDTVRAGNASLAGGDADPAVEALAQVRGMLAVLGLDPLAEPWTSADTAAGLELRAVVDALIRTLLDARQAARERKDYAAADALRDELKRSGVLIEDTAHGPRWTLAGGL
jgi:cysteinyl-tRNA synthetase